MNDLIINIEKQTRKVELNQVYLGNDHENLQENLVFQFDEFVNTLKSRSNYDFGEDLSSDDKIITLSTCTDDNNGRKVIHAKKIN